MTLGFMMKPAIGTVIHVTYTTASRHFVLHVWIQGAFSVDENRTTKRENSIKKDVSFVLK